MKIAKFTLMSLAAMTLFTANVEAKFNFGGAARAGRDADKPLTSDLTYADLESGKYKLSLKAGWERSSNGVFYSIDKGTGSKYLLIWITNRLANELKQRGDFVFAYDEKNETNAVLVPRHNLDGVKVREYKELDYKIVAYIPMDIVGDCRGELRKYSDINGDIVYVCLADDLDDVFTKRSWF